jgi:hypothetical protein
LIVDWLENGQAHETVYDANWYYLLFLYTFSIDYLKNESTILCHHRLLKYGTCFIEDSFISGSEQDIVHKRPPLILWDRTTIWKNLPEISYSEVMESDNGLSLWLEMFHRYGIAILRDVPATQVHNIVAFNYFVHLKKNCRVAYRVK